MNPSLSSGFSPPRQGFIKEDWNNPRGASHPKNQPGGYYRSTRWVVSSFRTREGFSPPS